MKKTLLILYLLIGCVNAATCQTYWDYCQNFTLPNYFLPDQNPYYFLSMNNLNSTNIDGVAYANTTVGNVYVKVYNRSADLGWDGPLRSIAGGVRRIYLSANTTTVNGTVPGVLEVCLNGTYKNTLPISEPIAAPETFSITKPVTTADFTPFYRRNWTFTDEITGDLFNFNAQSATTSMTVFCDNYDQFTVNLKTALGTGGGMTLQTLEQPKYFVYVNSLPPRIRQDNVNFLRDNYVLGNVTTGAQALSQFTALLVDWTGGQFYRSTVSFQKSINNTLQNVDVQTFDQSNYVYPVLQNATQYKVIIANNVSTRDLGPQYMVDSSTVKNIIVTTPDLSGFNTKWEGTNISIITTYSTSEISCTYVDTQPITYAGLYVYNTSTSGRGLIYNANASTQTGTISYAVGNRSLTYYAQCSVVSPTHGTRTREEIVNFQEDTAYFKGFNLNIASPTMGLSAAFLYTILSLGVVYLFAGIFSAKSYGIGAVVSSLINLFFIFVGWLTEPWWFGMYLLAYSAMMIMSENRQGVGG